MSLRWLAVFLRGRPQILNCRRKSQPRIGHTHPWLGLVFRRYHRRSTSLLGTKIWPHFKGFGLSSHRIVTRGLCYSLQKLKIPSFTAFCYKNQHFGWQPPIKNLCLVVSLYCCLHTVHSGPFLLQSYNFSLHQPLPAS